MPNRRATATAGKAAIGNEGHFFIQSHTTEERGRSEHLSHPRPSLGPFITDNYYLTRFYTTTHNSFGGFFLRIEHPGRTPVSHHLWRYGSPFHHGALRRQVTKENSNTP